MQYQFLTPRQKRVLQAVQSDPPVSIKELSPRVELSDSTLRRELQTLADMGLVIQQFGKVRLSFSSDSENPFLLRTGIQEDEKRRIAQAALDFVQNGDTIFISGGTTTLEFARLLPGQRRLTVITNALPVAYHLLGKRGIKLVILGGEVRQDEQTMHGHLTVYGIQQLRADKLFYGIEAISLEHGLTHSQLLEVSTDRALINACTQTIVLADHTKFGKVAPALVVAVSEVHVIITGSELSPELVEELSSLGVEVVLA
jgi:DeoR/GlpR family transcriptional regulator of sugar metabolism